LIQRHTLRNGLRVVLEDIPFVRSVSMGIWAGTGSRDERPDQGGVSHLIEHMFFKGTSKLNARQLAEVFDGIGGQINAYTAKEYTCFHAKVLDEHAELAMRTLADMLFDSLMDSDELEREKRVVIEEIKMYEDNPEEAVHDLIVEHTYSNHPLGANILGSESSLEGLGREQLLQYIAERYTPDNMVIAVCGHIVPELMLQLIEQLFGGFSRVRQEYVLATPTFQCANLYRSKPVEQSHVVLAWPGFHYEDARTYSLILLNTILGASSSSRLFQEIRENRGMAYSVFSYHSAFRDNGLFAIYFGASPAQSQGVLGLIEQMVAQWLKEGLTVEELLKAKNQVKGSLMLSLESTSSRMSRLGKNELLLRRQVDMDETIAEIDAVSLSQIDDLTKELFANPFSFVALGPDEFPLTRPQALSV